MSRTERVAPASPLATLMLAWVVVVGLASAPVITYYWQTGDIRVMIAFLGATFIIGIGLFIAMGLTRLGAASRPSRNEGGEILNLHKRGGLFGKR